MASWTTLFDHARSSVGRKATMAVTGLGLFVFLVVHLTGNFTLLIGADAFNGYAHMLEHLMHGAFLYFAEAGLLLFFAAHSASGIRVFLQRRAARTRGYESSGNAGGPSHKGPSSMTMAVTGPVILLFVAYHLASLKFGPGVEQGYVATLDGDQVRDLYSLVVGEFKKLPVVVLYLAVMAVVGLHLNHGVWSAFQSLGLANSRYLPLLGGASLAFAIVLAVGFLYIPIHLHLFVPFDAGARAVAAAGAGGGL